MQRLSHLLAVALLTLTQAAWANEAVPALRDALRAPASDLSQRTQQLRATAARLSGLAELRQAVALPDWRDADVDPGVAAVDRQARLLVVQQFQQAVRAALAAPATATQLTICDMLADLGVTVRGVGTRHGLARDFGLDLAALTVRGDMKVRLAATRALARIDAEPSVAAPAFAALLRDEHMELREAGAAGLVQMIRTATDLACVSHTAQGVQLTRAELVDVGRTVVPAAVTGLQDALPTVRRSCLEAVGRSAAALHRLILDPPAELQHGVLDQQSSRERAELLPLVDALRAQGPLLARALNDGDNEVRALALRTVEVLAEVRGRWQRRLGEAGDDPLLELLREALPGVLAELGGGGRPMRTAFNILESLGPEAAGAVPFLTQVLRSRDKFARWSAARTLGRIGPAAAPAVPALTPLLDDPDPDLALAAATTLQQLGPLAQAAVPDLAETVQTSRAAELRQAALRAIEAIGPPAATGALPTLARALRDPDARVRVAAAETLGRFGPEADVAVEALRQARNDRSPEVQTAAAAALLQIMQPR